VAVVVLANGKTASEADLIAHCRTLIAGYKVPKAITFSDNLPMTPSARYSRPPIPCPPRRERRLGVRVRW